MLKKKKKKKCARNSETSISKKQPYSVATRHTKNKKKQKNKTQTNKKLQKIIINETQVLFINQICSTQSKTHCSSSFECMINWCLYLH